MGIPKPPLPVKLFVGMLSSDRSLFDECIVRLTSEFGPIDMESRIWPWEHTQYYNDEIGPNLLRKFIFFSRLIDPGELALIKRKACTFEETFGVKTAETLRRKINIDPGYITEAKVVLASTKDFSHRVYIGDGIYAEVTLEYSREKKKFRALNHTYPDFRDETCIELFSTAREIFRNTVRNVKQQIHSST